MLLMVLFFFPLPFPPNLLLRNFDFVVVAFSLPTCSLIHGFASNGRGVGSI